MFKEYKYPFTSIILCLRSALTISLGVAWINVFNSVNEYILIDVFDNVSGYSDLLKSWTILSVLPLIGCNYK